MKLPKIEALDLRNPPYWAVDYAAVEARVLAHSNGREVFVPLMVYGTRTGRLPTSWGVMGGDDASS